MSYVWVCPKCQEEFRSSDIVRERTGEEEGPLWKVEKDMFIEWTEFLDEHAFYCCG